MAMLLAGAAGFAASRTSAADVEARYLADQVGTLLNQKFIVENKPGANGNLGAAEAALVAPDGLADHVRIQTELWGRIIQETGLEKI